MVGKYSGDDHAGYWLLLGCWLLVAREGYPWLPATKEQQGRLAPSGGAHPGILGSRDYTPWVLTPLGSLPPAAKGSLKVLRLLRTKVVRTSFGHKSNRLLNSYMSSATHL
jgi:hypothetical protein